MNGQTFVDEVRAARRTELDRLGSEKALLAVTRADLSSATILETLALSLDGLRTTLEGWAEETAADPVQETFASTAASLEDAYGRVAAQLDADPAGDPPVPVPTVRTHDGTVERVGAALVGHGLFFDGFCLQAVSFFVNEAEKRRADIVRDLRAGASDRVGAGERTLESLCGGDSDWTRAESAATDVIDAAYDEYVQRLTDLGIDPKPVC